VKRISLADLQKDDDAGRRIADTVALHFAASRDIFDVVGQWCAFRLSDGTGDGTLYPTKDLAILHQTGNPKDYCYLKITPDGITPKDARLYLQINRNPYIDTTAPENVIGPAIFPRFSNLSPIQRATLKAEAERQAREHRR
jgi:hypothetical protein